MMRGENPVVRFLRLCVVLCSFLVVDSFDECSGGKTILSASGDKTGTIDLFAFRAATKTLNDNGCIFFLWGVYYFDSNFYQLNNELTEPSVDCRGRWDCKDAVVFIRGRNNITIAGPPSSTGRSTADDPEDSRAILELVHYDKSRGDQFITPIIYVAESSNVTIRDLTMRHASTDINHEVGVVVAVPTSNSLLIRIPGDQLPLVPASYFEIDGDKIRNHQNCEHVKHIQKDVFYAEHFMRLDRNRKVTGWEFFADRGRSTGLRYDASYAKDQKECDKENNCAMVLVEFFNNPEHACRTPHDSVGANFEVGDHLLVLQQKRATSGIRFVHVDGLNLLYLTFGNIAGASIWGERVRNIRVVGQVTVPPPSGWRTVHDALWVLGYSGSSNLVEGMRLQNLSDDYLNFHTSVTMVDGRHVQKDLVEMASVCVRVKQDWWWEEHNSDKSFSSYAMIGDTINLYDKEQVQIWQGKFVGRTTSNAFTVACFRPSNPELPLLEKVAHLAVFAASPKWMPGEETDNGGMAALTIRDVTVLNSRARGTIRGSNTLIEGLTVVDNMMTGVLVLSEPTRKEGTPASYVTIRNSTFDNVALNTIAHISAIKVGSELFTGGAGLDSLSVHAQLHKNIAIENVMIRNQPQAAIFAAGVDGFMMQNVTLENVKGKADPNNQYNKKELARSIDPFVAAGSKPFFLLGVNCSDGFSNDNNCFPIPRKCGRGPCREKKIRKKDRDEKPKRRRRSRTSRTRERRRSPA